MTVIKKTIKNRLLQSDERMKIIELKNQHWEYPIESQLAWMKKNHKRNDEHLLFYRDNELIAYLYIAEVVVKLDKKRITALGIGNVCVSKTEKGTGLGKEIVLFANELIQKRNKLGILLCKDTLVGFYQKCGWESVKADEVYLLKDEYSREVMLLGASEKEYKSIVIKRSF